MRSRPRPLYPLGMTTEQPEHFKGYSEYVFWPIITPWEPVKDWALAAGGVILAIISLVLLACLTFAV